MGLYERAFLSLGMHQAQFDANQRLDPSTTRIYSLMVFRATGTKFDRTFQVIVGFNSIGIISFLFSVDLKECFYPVLSQTGLFVAHPVVVKCLV